MAAVSTETTISSQHQPDVPFSYVITRNKTDKTNWSALTKSFDSFVKIFLDRGHPTGEKDGTGIVAATFLPDSRLEDKNVQKVTAVILDVDGKIRENGIETISYIDPESFIAKLPFRGLAHTSYNHSADLAKFRVILPLAEPVSKEDFPRLWWWAFEAAGRVADPSCKNPSRMFYLPRRNSEVDPAIHWIRELHGRPLSLSDVPASYKPTGPGAPVSPRVRTGLHVSNSASRYQTVDPHHVLDELLALPLYVWALEFPGDVSREAWRGLATNLAALVVEDPEMYEATSTAFHNISRVDPNRYDYGTCERTFRDAVTSARNIGPMTWATLSVAGAPSEACAQHAERSPVAVARARVSRRARDQVRTTTLERANKPRQVPVPAEAASVVAPEPTDTPKPAVAPVAALTQEAKPPEGGGGGGDGGGPEDPPDSAPSLWFDPANFVFNCATNEWLQWNSKGRLVARVNDMSFTRILLANGHDKKNVETFKNLIPHVMATRAFYDKSDRVVTVDGVPYLNTYEPTELQPIPGDWEPIRQLLINLCGGDLIGVEFVLDWFATPLQSLQHGKPWKTLTSLVFQGSQGGGKGTIGGVMRAIYGLHNSVEFTQEALDSNFNDLILDKLLVIGNEVISSNNRSLETSNKLKTWITDPQINLEQKYHGRREVENNFNMFFMSNDPRPVLVEATDRRYIVFQSKPIPLDIASQIWMDLQGDKKMVSAFYAALLTRQSKLVKSQMYDTVARRHLMGLSLHSWEKFVNLIKEDGWLAVSRDWVAAANPNGPPRIAREKSDFVSMATFMAVYADFCRSQGIKAGSAGVVAPALKVVLPDVKSVRTRLGNNPVRGWEGLPMYPEDDTPQATIAVKPQTDEEAVPDMT